MMTQNQREILKNWAVQTILFAMSLKAHEQDAGYKLEEIPVSLEKAQKTAEFLFDDILAQVGNDESKLVPQFTEKVLDWTWQHRKGTNG
jgi:hypothetical protein